MRGFRLSRMFLRAAIRQSHHTRRKQPRRKVQSKRATITSQRSKTASSSRTYQPYAPPRHYSSPPPQIGQFFPQPGSRQQQVSMPSSSYQGQQPPPYYGNQSPVPFQPGQFQSPPPPPVLPHEPFTRWFSRQNRNTKIGCVVFSLLALLLLCGLCRGIGSAITASNSGPVTAALSATATPTQDTSLKPPTATPTLTPTPSPRPTPKPRPKPIPTQIVVRPTPTSAPHCVGVNNNPWCYDFNPGNLIVYPPAGFCNYFNCIPSFYGSDDPGDGYVIQCVDGTYSQSGGERGACSYHGGESRPLYSH